MPEKFYASDLSVRIDKFILDKLEHGDFAAPSATTRLILVTLIAAFPAERDVVKTFWERIAALGMHSTVDPRTRERRLHHIRLRSCCAARSYSRELQSDQTIPCRGQLLNLIEILDNNLNGVCHMLAEAPPPGLVDELLSVHEDLRIALASARAFDDSDVDGACRHVHPAAQRAVILQDDRDSRVRPDA